MQMSEQMEFGSKIWATITLIDGFMKEIRKFTIQIHHNSHLFVMLDIVLFYSKNKQFTLKQ